MVILKPAAIITHLAGWLIFISLPLLFLYRQQANENIFSSILLPDHLLFYFCYIFIFYFNAYLLIPQLYFQKKIALYCTVVLLLLLIICFLKPFEELILRSRQRFHSLGMVPPPGPMPLPGQSSANPPFVQRRLPPFSRGPFGNIDIVSILYLRRHFLCQWIISSRVL
jgi:two-component system, LytTR family, sensor kinase